MDETKTNTLEKFVETTKAIRALDIPSKETADALVRSAMRMVAIDLSNGNLSGAKHTADQLEAVEKFLKRKVEQQQADRITQNTVAAGRYRVIREIGRWLIDNVDHGTKRSAGGIANLSNDKSIDGLVIKVAKVLVELGIGETTYKRWLYIGALPDDDFDSFLSPYLDENIQQNMELYISLLYRLAVAWEKEPSKITEPSITLAPHLKAVYLATAYLRDKMQKAQSEIDKGNTPSSQVQFIFDQFTDLVDDINTFMRHTKDLYG